MEHRKTVTRLQIELDRTKDELRKLKELYLQLLYKYNRAKSECCEQCFYLQAAKKC